MHRRDPIGDRLHLFFACAGLICMLGPVTVTEIAFAPLLVFFIVRVFNTLPVWIHGFGQPLVLAAIALAGWMALSLRWSPDVATGWGEIGELRWLLLMGLLFPVIEHRRSLIAAVCVGVALGQLAQVLDALDGLGVPALARLVENHPDRIGGWWQPVVGGSILVGAMGLHLPGALFGCRRSRIWGLAGVSAAGLGVLATGSRGAWIAGVLLVLIVVFFSLLTRRIGLRRFLLVGGAVAMAALIGAWVMRAELRSRIDETRTEMSEISRGEYGSYSGRRAVMARGAFDAIRARPVTGVGAGGFKPWVSTHTPYRVHAHAHNSLLHIWATLGLVGVLLWALLIAIMLRGALRIADYDDEHHDIVAHDLGPMCAILGLLLASLTDSVQINTQTAALLGALAALSPAYVPGHAIRRKRTAAGDIAPGAE